MALEQLLQDFVLDVQRIRRGWQNREIVGSLTEIEQLDLSRHPLVWSEASQYAKDYVNRDLLDIEAARDAMRDGLAAYADMTDPDHALLLSLAPGMGKTYAGIALAQRQARFNQRVLYAMPRHNHWENIATTPNFDPALWYHWLSTTGINPETIEPMCKFHRQTSAWTAKGYPLMQACLSLCLDSGHFYQCPYRAQSKRQQPIIAGVHNHLTTGMAFPEFNLAIIDELPLSAFISERQVARKFIDIGGAGVVNEFLYQLQALSLRLAPGKQLRGPELLREIGPLLGRVIHDAEHNEAANFPKMSHLTQPEDALVAKEFYLFDLVRLLIPEHIAWSRGLESWLSRVYLTREGIHLLQREAVWDKAPRHLVILDATGEPAFYEALLNRPVEELNIHVANRGRLYQVAHRLNGRSTIFESTDQGPALLPGGEDLLTMIRLVQQSKPRPDGLFDRYNKVGVVTFKDLVPVVEDVVGEGNVMHFGGSRGANDFIRPDDGIPYDCVIVAGTPGPSDDAMADIFAQLYYDPDTPLESRLAPVNTERSWDWVEYLIVEDGLSPKRQLSGFYHEPDFQILYEAFTRAELRQAAGRARLKVQDIDVWMLTSIPIRDQMTMVFDQPGEAFNIPHGLKWQHWLTIFNYVERSKRPYLVPSQMAESFNVSTKTAKRWCDALRKWSPEEWEWSKISGIREKVLVRVQG